MLWTADPLGLFGLRKAENRFGCFWIFISFASAFLHVQGGVETKPALRPGFTLRRHVFLGDATPQEIAKQVPKAPRARSLRAAEMPEVLRPGKNVAAPRRVCSTAFPHTPWRVPTFEKLDLRDRSFPYPSFGN